MEVIFVKIRAEKVFFNLLLVLLVHEIRYQTCTLRETADLNEVEAKSDDSGAEEEMNMLNLAALDLARTRTHLDDDHPSRRLQPVDLLLVIDCSGSIGMTNFAKVCAGPDLSRRIPVFGKMRSRMENT